MSELKSKIPIIMEQAGAAIILGEYGACGLQLSTCSEPQKELLWEIENRGEVRGSVLAIYGINLLTTGITQ